MEMQKNGRATTTTYTHSMCAWMNRTYEAKKKEEWRREKKVTFGLEEKFTKFLDKLHIFPHLSTSNWFVRTSCTVFTMFYLKLFRVKCEKFKKAASFLQIWLRQMRTRLYHLIIHFCHNLTFKFLLNLMDFTVFSLFLHESLRFSGRKMGFSRFFSRLCDDKMVVWQKILPVIWNSFVCGFLWKWVCKSGRRRKRKKMSKINPRGNLEESWEVNFQEGKEPEKSFEEAQKKPISGLI